MRDHFLRRHRSWAAPLAVAIVAWSGVIWGAHYREAHPNPGNAGDTLAAFAVCLAVIVTAVCVGVTVRNGRRCRRAILHDRRIALVQNRYAMACAEGWQQAGTLARALLAGKRLTPVTVWGVVLRRSETAYLDVSADVAQATGVASWMDRLRSQVIGTDRRLVLNTGRRVSVWRDNIIGFYPEPDEWRVTLDAQGAPPLRMTGSQRH